MDYDPLAAELLHIIRERMDAHPRGLQRRIGPSEIGKACPRWLSYKLLGTEAVNPRSSSWRATVGTAVHTWLAETFEQANNDLGTHRYFVEEQVTIGELLGKDSYPIKGRSDLYVAKTVIDWKIVGKTTLDRAGRGHISDQYVVQAHSYGLGWEWGGFPVERVAIFFLPSAGELSQSVFWSQPFDRGIANEALNRINGIKTLVDHLGTQAPAQLPTVDDWCTSCEYLRLNETDLARACPGHQQGAAALCNKTPNEMFMKE